MLSNMANSFPFSMATTLMLGLFISISLHSTVAEVGVCYGRLGSNLPCPEDVVALYNQNNIKKMRLYDPDPDTLDALGGSGIELMLGIPEADLPELADIADDWVETNILSYPDVDFRYIAVGNEVNTTSSYAPFVLPAMQNVYNSLCDAGLDAQIAVSTSIRTDLLAKSSPPQDGEFKSDVTWFIKPIIEFLSDTNAPLLVNVYPYFAYMENPKNISREFALLEPNSSENLGGVRYDNLFYAIIDAVYMAMEKILAPSLSPSSSSAAFGESKQQKKGAKPSVTVSETGHSTKDRKPPGGAAEALGYGGGVGEYGDWSSVENARIYNNNLMRIVKKGTPMRPGIPIETYIFGMFDEDEKPGPEYERHFGIFSPDAKHKYPLRFY